jgi:hypothetical protein
MTQDQICCAGYLESIKMLKTINAFLDFASQHKAWTALAATATALLTFVCTTISTIPATVKIEVERSEQFEDYQSDGNKVDQVFKTVNQAVKAYHAAISRSSQDFGPKATAVPTPEEIDSSLDVIQSSYSDLSQAEGTFDGMKFRDAVLASYCLKFRDIAVEFREVIATVQTTYLDYKHGDKSALLQELPKFHDELEQNPRLMAEILASMQSFSSDASHQQKIWIDNLNQAVLERTFYEGRLYLAAGAVLFLIIIVYLAVAGYVAFRRSTERRRIVVP